MTIRWMSALVSLSLVPSFLAAQGLDTARIDQALGRSGQKTGEVYKVSFPRTDLTCDSARRRDQARAGARVVGSLPGH